MSGILKKDYQLAIQSLARKSDTLTEYENMISQLNDVNVIIQSLNNMAVSLMKYELLAFKVLKFVKKHLLKSEPTDSKWVPVIVICYLNLAKLYIQTGKYSKAYLLIESTLLKYEYRIFETINKQPSESDVILLINAYLLYVQSYELSPRNEIESSDQVQKGFQKEKIIAQAKKLALKHLGINHAISKRLNLNTHKPLVQTLFPKQQYSAAIPRNYLIRVDTLLKIIKVKFCAIVKLNFKASFQSSIEKNPSRVKTSADEQQKVSRASKIRRKYNPTPKEDSDETTREDKVGNLQIEHLIEKRIEEQLKIDAMKFNQVQNELMILQQEKLQSQANTNQLRDIVSMVQKELHDLKSHFAVQSIKIQEDIEAKHQLQIKLLQEQNLQLQEQINENTKKTNQQSSFIKEFQTIQSKPVAPFSFNKVQSEDYNAKCSAFDNKKIYKNLSGHSWSESEDLQINFVDQLSKNELHIQIQPYIIFRVQIQREIEFNLELQMVGQFTKDTVLKITAEIPNQKVPTFVTQELNLNQIESFLNITVNHLQLPYPIKMIGDFKSFIEFLIVPFISITQSGSKYNFELYPYPQGLIQEIQVQIFNIDCFCWFFVLDKYHYRLAIFTKNDFLNSFELKIDEALFNEIFQYQQDEFAVNEVQLISTMLNSGEACSTDRKNQVFKLSNLIIKDKSKLITTIQNTLREIELYFRQQNINSIKQIQDDTRIWMLQIRILQKQYRIAQINQVNDNDEFTLQLKNHYETFSPGSQVRASGQIRLDSQLFAELFGIEFKNLDSYDRVYLLSQIFDLFTLHVFSKVLQEDDYDCYKENAIQRVPLEYEGYYKAFTGDSYKNPVTMQLLGVLNKLYMIRINYFNVEQMQERGVLLTINPENWLKFIDTDKQFKKKRDQKYKTESTISRGFELNNILNSKGWDLLIRQLLLDDNGQLFINMNKSELQISKLESHLNCRAIQDSFK